MKIQDIDPDLTYKLPKAVRNPKGDARTKFVWHRAKTWKEGTKWRFAWVESELFRELAKDHGKDATMEELWIFPFDASHANGKRLASYVFEQGKGDKPGQHEMKLEDDYMDFADLVEALVPILDKTFDTVRDRYIERGVDFDRAVLKWLVQEGHVKLAKVEEGFKLAKANEIYDLIGEPNE